MYPVTLLTAFVLEQMTKRGKGVVVNISSTIAYTNFYWLALYAATKVMIDDSSGAYSQINPHFLQTYVNWLSATLRQEYAPQKGIIIQTVSNVPLLNPCIIQLVKTNI
jgi:NAD(P)-dependent dehydrogenase (short-subunit alcohol dehydrogenase family)